jgi:Domain of unknown function (DUF397)
LSTTPGELGERPHRSAAVVAVRDTKDKMGPVLHFDPSAWHAFTEHLKG